jgi:molybdenum cofactor biosynthesis enzyme MoaA
MFRYFSENKLIDKDATVELASGELGINPDAENIIELCSVGGHPVTLASNATVYNRKISELLGFPNSMMMVSMDSGTPETFYKIKRLDVFHQVVANIKKYRTDNAKVCLKYIILPGINDNDADITGFLELAEECDIGEILISHDMYDKNALTPHAVDMTASLIALAERRSISASVNNTAFIKDDWARIADVVNKLKLGEEI